MIYYRYVELYLREQGDCVPGNVMADYKRPANMCVCVCACVRACVCVCSGQLTVHNILKIRDKA